MALLTDLGLAYYHYGYFSRAIDAWEQAWGRAVQSPIRPSGRWSIRPSAS